MIRWRIDCISWSFLWVYYFMSCLSTKTFVEPRPATQNAQLPSCSQVLGIIKSPRAAERRAERLGTVETGMHSSFRQHSARPWIALYTSRQSLNELHSLARSQCRWSRSSGVTWWRLLPPNITLTVQLSTRCSLSRVCLVQPPRRLRLLTTIAAMIRVTACWFADESAAIRGGYRGWQEWLVTPSLREKKL